MLRSLLNKIVYKLSRETGDNKIKRKLGLKKLISDPHPSQRDEGSIFACLKGMSCSRKCTRANRGLLEVVGELEEASSEPGGCSAAHQAPIPVCVPAWIKESTLVYQKNVVIQSVYLASLPKTPIPDEDNQDCARGFVDEEGITNSMGDGGHPQRQVPSPKEE